MILSSGLQNSRTLPFVALQHRLSISLFEWQNQIVAGHTARHELPFCNCFMLLDQLMAPLYVANRQWVNDIYGARRTCLSCGKKHKKLKLLGHCRGASRPAPPFTRASAVSTRPLATA